MLRRLAIGWLGLSLKIAPVVHAETSFNDKAKEPRLGCGTLLPMLAPLALLPYLAYKIVESIHEEYFAMQGAYSDDEKKRDLELIAKAKRGENSFLIPVAVGSKRPRIVIFPERHDSSACLAIVDENRADSSAGQCVFAEEGKLEGAENGIEEPSSRLLSLALLSSGATKDYFFGNMRGAAFLKEVSDSPEFSKPIWEKTKAELLVALEHQAAQLKGVDGAAKAVAESRQALAQIDRLYAIPTTEERREYLEKNQNTVGAIGKAMPLLMLPHLISAQPQSAKDRFPQLEVLKDFRSFGDLQDEKKRDAFMSVILDMRNDAFARSVLKLYEKESAGEGKEIRVRIGAAHWPGVYHLLRTSLDASNGGKSVELRTDERHLEYWDMRRMKGYEPRKSMIQEINAYEQRRREAKP